MASAFAGKGGSVYIPGTPNVPLASINTWAISVSADNYESSVLGDSWKEFVAGLRGWSGKITGFYNVVNDTTGQYQLYNALLTGASVVLQLTTGNQPGEGFFEGVANITQCDVSDPVNNVITIDFTFVGNGSLQHSP